MNYPHQSQRGDSRVALIKNKQKGKPGREKKMRDLVFKNITSDDKKRKILASYETTDKQGVHSVVRRHFIYIVKEVSGAEMQKPSPDLYVFKERNTREQRENFFCRMKGSVYAVYNDKIFLILFMHSLKIKITAYV